MRRRAFLDHHDVSHSNEGEDERAFQEVMGHSSTPCPTFPFGLEERVDALLGDRHKHHQEFFLQAQLALSMNNSNLVHD